MYYTLVSFKTVPKIGFAHHFYAETYHYTREKLENSLEVVYIKEGNMDISYDGETIVAPVGSVFVFPRTLPLTLKTGQHAHCSVQLLSDFHFEIVNSKENIPADFGGLVLPFVTPEGRTSEAVKKQLYSIVSQLSVSRELNEFPSSVCALGVLELLHTQFKAESLNNMRAPSVLCYRIKRYVAEHLNENLFLSDIAEELGKTAIYLNAVFKKETGASIGQYINREKIRLIADLMLNKGTSFKSACESAGILDVSYGYRLFKKQMGVTPGEYRHSQKFSY